MKLLLYSHAFAPKVGGVETVVMLLAKGITRRELPDGRARPAVTVITQTPKDGFDDASLPFEVIRRPSFLRLLRLIRHADVLHLAGPAFLPMVLAALQRKPVVLEHHGFQAICPNGQMLYALQQRTCPGHFMAGRHRECLRCNRDAGLLASFKLWALTFPRRWLCFCSRWNVAPTNWLATQLQLPRMTSIHHGIPSHSVSGATTVAGTFAFVGRLVATKGVATLIEATRKLSSEGLACRIKIIGEGPERPRLQRHLDEMGIASSVLFMGNLPSDRLEDELQDVTAIVMPSLAGEVFGMVVLENMVRGKVVIASDIGPLREVVGEAGLFFPSGDAVALADRMRQVLTNGGLVSALKERARRRAEEEFGLENSVSRHLALYWGSIS